MGHLAGIISGYSEFDRHIQTVNGSKVFVGDNFSATLTKDGSHLDSKLYPFDLMNTSLSPGVRKLPSLIDLQILNAVRSLEWGSGGVGGNALQAPLNSDPLIGILNGDFDTQADWTTRGAANILNSQAILTEDSPFNSNFTQTFIIPSHAKYLQFTILDTQLGTNEFAPNDAFEVALLDARTLTPLVGTSIGLTQTDSLLNLQQSGNAYFSDKVKIAGANTSGDKIALNTPRTVKIDISNIAPGTLATLYFDLLGFGAKDGKVIVDNVMLLDKDLISPIAIADTATTDQAKPVLINILANDSDADSSINPTTLTIKTNPSNGAIALNLDGTVTYTPNPTFVGTDTFTYTITDTDGLTSNTATVNITVNNIAPIITVITGDTTTTEGTIANFTATAVDPGDELTYLWNFGDGSQLLEGQNVTHAYADNGTYIATLTVVDSQRVNSFQSLEITVNNAAPKVNAGADQSINEGQSVTFNGQFSDSGILDTHTITWDFGDGTTIAGILNPTHIYTSDGTYAASLTVTDNAGASTIDTLAVTVNNLAPTITQLTGTTEVAEGTPANFSASATDPGNDTLTYTWNFGDGSNPVQGKDATHTFLDNGIYTVSLTVSDSDGASTTQTLSTKVNNVAASVNAGTDQTMYQNEPVIFDGQFHDPGILDTHTIEWNFGDGNTVTSVLNPNHIYTLAGEYTVTLTITDNSGAVTNDTMTVTVKKPPTMSVSDISIIEGDNGNKYAVFTANLSEASQRTITANYSTTDGTATNGSDYTATNGTISFASGEISKTITIQLIGDTLDEFDETFFVNLSDATNATILTNQATATILDDDAAPTLTIGDRTITEGDNGTSTITYTINLNTPSGKPVSVNYTTADGTATAGTDYTASNGIVSFAPGETSKTITVEVLGDAIDEFDETFFLNLSDATNATITKNQAVTTILDNDAPPSITIGDRTITETDNGAIALTYTISLDAPSAKPISVKYTTADGTATALTDYTATNGSITFAPGETSKTVTVQVLGDTIDEFDETFFLNLSDATNATITNNQAVSTIVDNDAPPVLTINDRTITEGDNGTATVTFTVNLSAASAKAIAVNYATLDGTAHSGSDYTATNGTLTFAPLETSKTISVQVLGDTIDEFDESFFLNLSNATNATIADAQGAGTILDNDAPPTLTINDKTITEGDNGTQTMTFTVSLSAVSQKTIDVNYTTANGTATSGSDYTATNGTLTFAPGETTKTVSVQIIGDRTIESDETFNINLTSATNATISDAQGVGTILNNDLPPAFAIKAEGTVTINGGGDFDGNPLDLSDDALIYAGKGFTINGNPTLPIQRDAQGNPIRDANGKLVLVDRAVAVAEGYTVTNGPNNYANLLPPQVVDKQTINIPVYADVKQLELNRRIPTGTPTVTFNVSQNPMNNANDWAAKFPPPGTASNPTVVRVTGGGLNVPTNITISNYVIIVEQGDINFNGNGHNFNHVVLVSNNGNINLSNLQARDLSVFASGSINMNGGARFAGSTLMANGSGNITFNGATTTTDTTSNLKVISSGDITYNGAANTRGTFQAVKNFNYNGNSTLFGSIEVKGNITFNSGATVTAVGV
ncbi:Calx-beta domain-containing protein [Nostoc sp. ChiQUE01b]|uniref:beta strand repeat-containing protein n=1 Tax=Nostoc sp. ChiQUE01b TaxID=3075376 RepID=UPI003A0FF8E7